MFNYIIHRFHTVLHIFRILMCVALLWHTYVLDRKMAYIGQSEYIFWQPSFNVRDLIPDLTVEGLFKALQKKFNLAIYYIEDINTVRISYRKPIITSTSFIDLTSISGPVQEVDDQAAVDGVRLESEIDTSDLLSEEDFVDTGTPESNNQYQTEWLGC